MSLKKVFFFKALVNSGFQGFLSLQDGLFGYFNAMKTQSRLGFYRKRMKKKNFV
jgi:hypothetical protein